MFRFEKMPPDLTYDSHSWYVVDRERDVWMESLGSNGPRGDLVFALCVRGRKIAFEVANDGVTDGLVVHQITTFGRSYQAEFAHGIRVQDVPDPDETFALQELAAEALLVYHAGQRARFGRTSEGHRVALSAGDQPVYNLTDFGYDGGVSTDGAIND
ncbi:hypothetical protein [Cellulomonas xiejunii]|uniref:Uncharacterized protein n=1 Tax=Cellulomonas xiejunii TaxID=2968083 RepID=A0ABY5KT11_9CELL|nr:hypothetical protein [Cellulomonas xiejunii]MCC2314059.1 hypothetical protein [Cellulomonas xiejunii]MCC2322316.1 hypothetical protein [Cellulomonas xiejunii]UUI72367.1 hypothetical protein NP048_02540 [Cellulomonas xiejunii]